MTNQLKKNRNWCKVCNYFVTLPVLQPPSRTYQNQSRTLKNNFVLKENFRDVTIPYAMLSSYLKIQLQFLAMTLDIEELLSQKSVKSWCLQIMGSWRWIRNYTCFAKQKKRNFSVIEILPCVLLCLCPSWFHRGSKTKILMMPNQLAANVCTTLYYNVIVIVLLACNYFYYYFCNYNIISFTSLL